MAHWPAPTAADIAAAARRIAGIAWHTPLLRSAWLSDLTGADVWLKLELAQQTGSFKIRGAANAFAALRERQPGVRGVVTASADASVPSPFSRPTSESTWKVMISTALR